MSITKFDRGFLISPIGIFKVCSFIIALICLALLGTTQFWMFSSFEALYVGIFTFSFILLAQLLSVSIYIFQLYRTSCLQTISWKLLEISLAIICAICSLLTMAFSSAAANNTRQAAPRDILPVTTACVACSAILFISFAIYALMIFRRDVVTSESARNMSVWNRILLFRSYAAGDGDREHGKLHEPGFQTNFSFLICACSLLEVTIVVSYANHWCISIY